MSGYKASVVARSVGGVRVLNTCPISEFRKRRRAYFPSISSSELSSPIQVGDLLSGLEGLYVINPLRWASLSFSKHWFNIEISPDVKLKVP